MAIKFNPLTGSFDVVVDTADDTKYDNSTSGLTAADVQAAIDEVDGNLDSHLDGGANKHDATEIDYERADGSKKNIQAGSDEVEAALTDLDDAIGSLDASPSNYTPASPTIVASHLVGIDTALGSLTSTINNFGWHDPVLDKDLTAPPVGPPIGARYLLGTDTTASIVTGAWAGHDGEMAEWDGSAWVFTSGSNGSFLNVADETNNLYLFGGTTWTAKDFEQTTASGFLSKSGFDIQLTNLSDGNLIVGNSSNVATSVNTASVGDIDADTVAGLTIKPLVIVDGDINGSAAIARTKLASGTANHVIINDGSGVFSSEANLAISRGGTGAGTALAGFDNLSPLTTKGDILTRNGSNNIRIPVGSNGEVLTADSAEAGGVKWSAAGQPFVVSSISTNTNAVSGTTYLVDTTAAVQVTLPTPAANAFVRIKDATGGAEANSITVARSGSENIDGVAANVTIDSPYAAEIFVSDGTDWFIL